MAGKAFSVSAPKIWHPLTSRLSRLWFWTDWCVTDWLCIA